MMLILYFITIPFFIKFVHYCIGSPIQGEYYTGRIFSFYGRFISNKYKEWEQKENDRVWAIYDYWKLNKDKELNEKLQNASFDQTDKIYKDFLKEVESEYNKIESKMKPNPYSMMGACPVCFGVWIGLFCWFFICILHPLPIWFCLIGSASSTILSRYIKIN